MTHTPSLALRSLLARPSRTILTTAGVVLGVAVILAISITNLSALDSLKAVFSEASGRAHLVVISSTDDGEGFPAEERSNALPDAPKRHCGRHPEFPYSPFEDA